MSDKPSTVFQRLTEGVKYIVAGVTPGGWFSPSQPLAPVAQDAAWGRMLDYPVGVNLAYSPRSTESVTFAQLRSLADGYDLLRLVIETRKDQMCKFKWKIGPIDAEAIADDRCKEFADMLRYPDREHSWDVWLRAVLEEMLVTDAACLMPRMSRGGGLYSINLIDGATIKRIIDQSGRTPVPPSVAYQQVIKGLPTVDYSADDLMYRPRNFRVSRFYGYSPVEQIIATVNVALRRQLSQLAYYTDGSTPDLIFQCPETWSPDQIAEFQSYWSSLLVGNTAARRGAMFVPSGVKPYNSKDMLLKDEYDEWLARIVCYAFSIAPTPFVKQMNRATAETVTQQALTEGILPLQVWVKDQIDYVLQRYTGYTDLEFQWDAEVSIDPAVQAVIYVSYKKAGIMTDDEVREELNLDPLTPLQREALAPEPPRLVAGDAETVADNADDPTAKITKSQKKRSSLSPEIARSRATRASVSRLY